MRSKLYAWWLWALSFFPVTLPLTAEAFERYVTRLFKAYGFSDTSEMRALVAGMVMHVEAPRFTKAPRYFAGVVRNSMSKQVAYNVIQAERQALKDAAALKAADAQPISNA